MKRSQTRPVLIVVALLLLAALVAFPLEQVLAPILLLATLGLGLAVIADARRIAWAIFGTTIVLAVLLTFFPPWAAGVRAGLGAPWATSSPKTLLLFGGLLLAMAGGLLVAGKLLSRRKEPRREKSGLRSKVHLVEPELRENGSHSLPEASRRGDDLGLFEES